MVVLRTSSFYDLSNPIRCIIYPPPPLINISAHSESEKDIEGDEVAAKRLYSHSEDEQVQDEQVQDEEDGHDDMEAYKENMLPIQNSF